jgi:transcriptional regulator with XRE-family HTH domain
MGMARPKSDPKIVKRRKVLGLRLKSERSQAKLSQQRLADLLGVPKIDVQRFENGAKVIPLDLLPTLCGALGITAAKLLGDDRGLLTRSI